MKRRRSKQELDKIHERLECEGCKKCLLVETNRIMRIFFDNPNQRRPKIIICPECKKENSYDELQNYINKIEKP